MSAPTAWAAGGPENEPRSREIEAAEYLAEPRLVLREPDARRAQPLSGARVALCLVLATLAGMLFGLGVLWAVPALLP